MSSNARAKVLRALQNGEITRVGSEKTIAIDVRDRRHNKDLEEEINRSFREDLYFRLNVIPIEPPLPASVRTFSARSGFFRKYFSDNGMRDKPIDGVYEALTSRPWPGNVRELQNVVDAWRFDNKSNRNRRRAATWENRACVRQTAEAMGMWAASILDSVGEDDALSQRLSEQSDSQYILRTLESVAWNISRAADLLGVERTNLHKKMRHLASSAVMITRLLKMIWSFLRSAVAYVVFYVVTKRWRNTRKIFCRRMKRNRLATVFAAAD
ncbi:MAG: sigma 54-interacting transcriptional regulator [Polyangiales bacterium]